MVYAFIFAVFLLIGLVLYAITRERGFNVENGGGGVIGIRELADELRSPDSVGVSPKIYKVKRNLRRGYNTIVKKAGKGEDLYEFEKWIYENYFHVLDSLKTREFKWFAGLPHKYNRARIDIIAEYIVRNNNGIVNSDSVKEIIDGFNSYTTLHIDEIKALKQAIKLALIRDVAALAAKSPLFERGRKAALNDKFIVFRKISNDSYLYWRKMCGMDVKNSDIIAKSDINVDNIEYDFSSALIDYGERVSNAVKSIKILNEIFRNDFMLGLSDTHKVLLSDSSYARTDENSQLTYLELIEKYSIIYNKSERAIVDACLELERKSGEHFGSFLFKRRLLKAELEGVPYGTVSEISSKTVQILYMTTVYGVNTVLSVILGLLTWNIAYGISLGILSWFALIKTSEFLVQKAHKAFLDKRPIPRLKEKSLKEADSVLVVVPHYISSKEDLTSAIENIKVLRAGNYGENINFALLIDYKKSDKPIMPCELEWNKYIDDSLCDYTDITYFIRRKIKINGSYSGAERKRGAITAMNSMLLGGDTDEFSHIGKSVKCPTFVITLDADSKLMPGAVLNAVNTISHPINNKYDLMTFNNAYNMLTMSTVYSKQYYFSSGYEGYGNYSDYYYNFLGKSIFCGKGIYRLASFYDKLDGVLPKNKVLSHDIIEGAIVNTGALTETVYEDIPNTSMSDVDRRDRWLSGDIQLLDFVGSKFKNQKGKKIKVDKDPIYSYIMLNNVLKAIGETALFAMLFIALFSLNFVYALPFIIAAFLTPLIMAFDYSLGANKGIRLRYVLRAIAAKIVETIFYVLILPFYAVNTVLVFIRYYINKMLGKGELKWRPYSASQSFSGLLSYCRLMLPAFIVLMSIIAGIIIAGYYNLWVIGYTAVSCAVLLALFTVNVPHNKKKLAVSLNQTEELNVIARKTYSFFKNMTQDNALITDNYQEEPYIGKAKNTSPTNIGFSLTAEVSAYELGIIDLKSAENNILRILNAVNKLKKYKGHLYNWYDIRTYKPLKPYYISSVDSGNFVASLIAVKEFLKKYNLNGVDVAERLIDATDFSALYDSDRGLYRIGYNTETKKFDGHYDLLASEARILYFITAAISKDTSAWGNLSRDVAGNYGNTLMSWSGTMFEYLMPEIFLKGSEYGLLTRSNQGAVKAQLSNKCQGLWGISESGYYKFDGSLRYQYHAFGLSNLAKRSEPDRCVIAPYASLLALKYAPKQVMQNISFLKDRGAYRESGFYEAIDYTGGKHIVKSYMAHHQGMILASITNYLRDNAIVNYFMSDERMKSAELLLSERNILVRASKRERPDFKYEKTVDREGYQYNVKSGENIKLCTLTNGKYSVNIDNNGMGYSICDDNYINRFRFDGGMWGILPLYRMGNKKFSPIAGCKTGGKHDVEFGMDEASYIGDNCRMNVYVPHCINGELRKFTWYNDTDKAQNVTLELYCDLAVSRFDDDISHPAFSDLFISTKYDEENKTVIVERKSRDNTESKYVSFTFIGADNLDIETNKYNFLGRGGTIENRYPCDKYPKTGDVLYPCIGASINCTVEAEDTSDVYLVVCYSDKPEALYEQISLSRDKYYVEYLKDSAMVNSLSLAKKHDMSADALKSCRNLAVHILTDNYIQDLSHYDMQGIYGNIGLNGLIKSLLIEYDNNFNTVKTVIDYVDYLNICGIRCNLIVALKDSGIYHDKNIQYIYDKCNDRIKALHNPVSQEIADTVFMSIDSASINEYTRSIPDIRIRLADESVDCSLNSHNSSIIKNIDIKTGSGGFVNGKYVVTEKPMLPYSKIISGEKGGTVITENGGGYTFSSNSRELKITDWINQPIEDKASEKIYLIADGEAVRINRLINGSVEYGNTVKFVNNVKGLAVKTEESMLEDGAIKSYKITIDNPNNVVYSVDIVADFDFIGYWRSTDAYMKYYLGGNAFVAENTLAKTKIYYTALGDCEACELRVMKTEKEIGLSAGEKSLKLHRIIPANGQINDYILISMEKELLSAVRKSNIGALIDRFKEKQNEITKITIKSDFPELDALFNNLMSQVVNSRVYGKCGYYQAGGAIGFRDQLQDMLAMLYSDPQFVRKMILDIASRQFPEGDALHWWHQPNKGVRTKISDDKLFLPYVVSEYIKFTGDEDILNESVSYLSGELLEEGEESRYDDYRESDYLESLLQHCKRAIDSALKFGTHGLLLIGAGDWNDALNNIGLKGRGESVWLTMFAYQVISEFIELLPSGERIGYLKTLDNLSAAVNNSFNGAWFKRAYTDDGLWLGDDSSPVCKIDLLCQAFGVLSGAADKKKASRAIDSAIERLVDKDKRIIKLLTPPFNSKNNFGYICAYPEGVRENGGQYTHAAVWFLIALCKLGRHDEAFELFEMINPVAKCATAEGNEMYMGEPFVLSGDVYASGQCGWSWYTGSAAWAYKLILEEFAGIRVVNNNISADPKRIKGFDNIEVTMKFGEALYNIKMTKGKKSLKINGINYPYGSIPIFREKKIYNCEIQF